LSLGCAVVYQRRRSDGICSELRRLNCGSYFGAVALMPNLPNAATVVAAGDLICARLNADDFRRYIKPVLDSL